MTERSDPPTLEGVRPGRGWRAIRAGRIAVEVLIIVTGVLIALAAEGLRERRSDRAMARSYVQGLEADLRADSADYARLLAPNWLPAQAAAVDSLVVVLSDPTRDEDPVRVLRWDRESTVLPLLAAKRRGTFDDLVGSGRLALIEDAALRRGLVQYYAVPIVTDDSSYQAYLITSYFPYVHRLGLVLGAARFQAAGACDVSEERGAEFERANRKCYEAVSRGDELALLRADPEMAALISDQFMQRFFAMLGVERAHDQALALLERLRGSREEAGA